MFLGSCCGVRIAVGAKGGSSSYCGNKKVAQFDWSSPTGKLSSEQNVELPHSTCSVGRSLEKLGRR